MKCCRECFREHANPLRAFTSATAATAPMASCDLCDAEAADVWDARVLLDAFAGVIGHYEVVDPGTDQSGPLTERLQRDWSIFSVEDLGRIHAFLCAVVDGSPDALLNMVVNSDANVRLRRKEEDPVNDPVDAWDRFTEELMYGNRYFPSVSNDRDFFERTVSLRVKRIDPGVVLYRARVCDTPDGHVLEKMGMPPRESARAGRASPLGIPHLYLGKEPDTCIQESRAAQHNLVTVAKFEVVDPLVVLNLKDFVALDPFVIEDQAAAQLDAARTLERLGYELRKPVRPTDDEVEYIPTQYLSGLVKSLEHDGILYASSLREGGTNLVLFSDSKVRMTGELVTYEVTSMRLETSEVVTRP